MKKTAKKGKKISPAEEWTARQRALRLKAAEEYKERHKREMEEQILPYLRDMFAGNAMEGFLANPNQEQVRMKGVLKTINPTQLASDAYFIADAMMAARAKPKETK